MVYVMGWDAMSVYHEMSAKLLLSTEGLCLASLNPEF
jgi:hypothetical protein